MENLKLTLYECVAPKEAIVYQRKKSRHSVD